MGLLRLAAAGLFALVSCVTHAQSYPTQPVSIVVGFSPGGSNDILARLIAPKLSEALKVPVYVDNKAGANGHIGLQYVARAKPDGYTIYLGSASPLVLNPIINKSVKFSIESDVVPVNTVATTFQVVATGSGTKFKSLKQLVDTAKGKSQTVTVGTSGVAGNNHVLLEVVNAATGAGLLHVPYKGTGPAIVDAMSGQVSAMIADYPGILAVKDGNGLNVLAVADSQRSRFLPDVPTIGEALNLGTDIDLTNWFAVVAPKGTPESVRKVLFDAVSYAAADKEIQDKLTAAGYLSFSQKSVAATEQFIAAENAKWKSLVNKPEVQRNLQN
jgi:tripartite-type tricarboxylate transporter receptor subunit TctC